MAKRKSIDEYRAKRDFERTPEPPPEQETPPPSAKFVVHRHEARRLHYDLRLEMEGVLKSWAVPRGFNYDPTVKKLAVRTEDHPLAYEEFSGVIPKGEYGGGTMTIWDRGRFELPKLDRFEDGAKAVEAGKLEFILHGKKLRGEWHLVRTRGDKDEWILFKARDRYVRAEDDRQPFFELHGAVETSIPDGLTPMRASDTTRSPFSNPEWLYEAEFDGVRCVIVKQGDTVRPSTGLTSPEWNRVARAVVMASDLLGLRAEHAIVDGVLLVNDERGRPSREMLDRYLKSEIEATPLFYAFDLLYYEQWDLRPLPLIERKELLSTLVPKDRHLLFVDHVRGRGEDFAAVSQSAGLRAIVAKKADSPYGEGPSESWQRIALKELDSGGKHLLDSLKQSHRGNKRRIQFSNLNKVFWPEQGYTKGDLINYYGQVAEFLLPYLYERPCHMLRYPDGIDGKSFYQKDAPDHTPEWVETEQIASEGRGESINYIICNDRDTLLWMANLGSIDLHPWFSRRRSQNHPDYAIFDLDPDGSPFPDVVRIARTLGKVLRGVGLRPYVKTSGATGIHIYVPVIEGYSYDHTKQFCEAVSIYVAAEHKDIATVERVVSRRRGKVYIDFLQNRKGQTVVPAYVVRPVPMAAVSAPLDWDELDLGLKPTDFTIRTILPRLERRGDLFSAVLTDRQDLLPAIEKFQEIYINKR